MNHSFSQIIATIGPASGSKGILAEMVAHQMDAARLNFSHGTYEEHREYIRLIREVSLEAGRRIPIIQDLSGPRMKSEEGHALDPEMREVITQKDEKDLEFGLGQDVDYVAISYVKEKKDIEDLRNLMRRLGKEKPVIAKIERKEAVENLDAIVRVSDAVMVARGDLGQAFSVEQVPFLQKIIVTKCRKAKKPVIVATQMLVSMTENPQPTRAEVSDIVHAILEGADALMLSEETAVGKFPAEAVAYMEKIILEAEKHLKKFKPRVL